MTGFTPLVRPEPAEPPRIWNMLDRVFAARSHLHQQHIEPIFIPQATMPEKPTIGHPGDVSLLPSAYRLEPAPVSAGPPGFHFDERHHPSLPNDQIDIVMTQAEAVRLDRPAARGEECDGETLAFHPEQMALIFPFADWNEPAGCAHAAQYAPPAGKRDRSAAIRGRKVRFGLAVASGFTPR